MIVINPGVRQCDAVGEIQKALFYGTPEFGGEYSSYCNMLPTGKGTSASHLTATQDKFVEGEATIIELSGYIKDTIVQWLEQFYLESLIKRKLIL